jgi:hypothetical protein
LHAVSIDESDPFGSSRNGSIRFIVIQCSYVKSGSTCQGMTGEV